MVVLNRPMSLVRARGPQQEAVFFFRLKLNLPEGEGLSGRSELWQRTFDRHFADPDAVLLDFSR